jgi:HicA toxin of bacterial toxin-antitoxin,
MPDPDKIKAALLDSAKDYGHRFSDVVGFLEATGWRRRTKGSHHIFTRPGVPLLLNLQPEHSGKAKAYQVRQVRHVLLKFKL